MKEFFREIDVNKRLSAEQHALLSLFYRKQVGTNLKYETLVIYEDLINDFNKCVTNSKCLEKFREFVDTYNDNEIGKFIRNFNEKPWEYEKPIIWGDRKKSAYYIKNLTLSHRFEVYIERVFSDLGIDIGLYYGKEEQYDKGETKLGIEIKRDIRSHETGNLYIEYNERLNVNGNWYPSGILKQDNTRYFLIGDIDKYWILRKSDLMEIFEKLTQRRENIPKGCRLVNAVIGTSKGYIIPKYVADKLNVQLDVLTKELQLRK